MDPDAVVPWAEAFISGVRIESVGSLVWCGAILLVSVRAMPPQNSQLTINSKNGVSTGGIGLQRISVTGTLVKRLFCREWYVNGAIEIVQNISNKKQSVTISGRHKIIVGERGDSPWVRGRVRSVTDWGEAA